MRHLRTNGSCYGPDQGRIRVWGPSACRELVALLGTTNASSGFDGVGGYPGSSSREQATVALSPITDFTYLGGAP